MKTEHIVLGGLALGGLALALSPDARKKTKKAVGLSGGGRTITIYTNEKKINNKIKQKVKKMFPNMEYTKITKQPFLGEVLYIFNKKDIPIASANVDKKRGKVVITTTEGEKLND